jgi:beta-lactamase regulating signal transducer with metallopeptidase domain
MFSKNTTELFLIIDNTGFSPSGDTGSEDIELNVQMSLDYRPTTHYFLLIWVFGAIDAVLFLGILITLKIYMRNKHKLREFISYHQKEAKKPSVLKHSSATIALS